MDCTFEEYCVNIGIRSLEYTYDVSTIMKHIDHFRDCHRRGFSAYKALLYLNAHIEHLAGRNSVQKLPDVPFEFLERFVNQLDREEILKRLDDYKREKGIPDD
jgi:hypothetical protein